MTRVVIACAKSWGQQPSFLANFNDCQVSLITEQSALNPQALAEIDPEFVFVLHWNWIVEPAVYQQFNCVVFHTSPLPYGRGGSPIQNLILQGHQAAPVCAIKMTDVLDGGAIYCQQEISLAGTISEIFSRIEAAVVVLIKQILEQRPDPIPQTGEVTLFKRRQPEESKLDLSESLALLYDKIRMVDGLDYPKAFIEHQGCRLEFSQAVLSDDCLEAKVVIRQ